MQWLTNSMGDADLEAIYAPSARGVLTAFGIEADEFALVAASENLTFRVTDRRDGVAYVLRLHRPGYHTLEELDSERIWTEALAKAGVRAPVHRPASDGRYYVPVRIEAAQEMRFAGMSLWTDGEPLADVLSRTVTVAEAEAYYAELGSMVAATHNQSSVWKPPAGFTRHHLDADGLMGDAPFWGRFWEHPGLSAEEQRQLLSGRQSVREARGSMSRAAYSVIHADLHPGNLLVKDRILTIIDFDDAGWGWHSYDIAVALVHQQDSPGFGAIEAAFVQGYRKRRALSEASRAQLPLFLMIRDMALIGWLHQRPEIKADERFQALKGRACKAAAAFQGIV